MMKPLTAIVRKSGSSPIHHPILSDIGYVEIYATSVRRGANFLHVHNQVDPCCFGPEGQDFESQFQEVLESAGGEQASGCYSVFVDTSGEGHAIREDAIEIITELMEKHFGNH